MKGKAAAQNANRRANEAGTAVEVMKAQLKEQERLHREEVNRLKSEIRILRNDMNRFAGEAAAGMQEQINTSRGDARKALGGTYGALKMADRFAFNACRYISMTKGYTPASALGMVLTWVTELDTQETIFQTGSRESFLLRAGIAPNGWVAKVIRDERFWMGKLARRGETAGITLDRALAEGHRDIHPRYQDWWYASAYEWNDEKLRFIAELPSDPKWWGEDAPDVDLGPTSKDWVGAIAGDVT